MKLVGNVISAEDHGDTLAVAIQGKEKSGPDWRPMVASIFKIANTKTNRKAFYVGRKVEVTISPIAD